MRKVLLFILLLALLAGCDVFGIRDSEDPSDPPAWNNFSTVWEQTVQNLEYSYTDARNVVKYSSIFLGSYRFYFAAQDLVDYDIPDNWNSTPITAERDMLLNLQNAAKKITVTLSTIDDSPDQVLANEARVFRNYSLSVKTSSSTQYYTGSFELQLNRSGAYWYISKWYDYRSGNSQSWGKLKYEYSQ